MNENERALEEEVKRQQEEFANAEVGEILERAEVVLKRRKQETSVNSKKRRMPAEKRRDRDKQYDSEEEDEERLLTDEMDLERNFNAADCKTNMEKFAVQSTREIIYQEHAIDDLKAEMFVLVVIIAGIKLKTDYA